MSEPDPPRSGLEPPSTAVDGINSRAELGALLTRLRSQSGRSLRDLARSIGSSSSTLGDWCRGDRLPFPSQQATFQKMLLELGVAVPAPWIDALVRLRDGQARRRDGPAPYRGLESFGIEQAEWFFGRDELIARTHDVLGQLVAQHQHARLLAVVGASGSGKSSVLNAGLRPLLEDAGTACLPMTPGPAPLERLGDALATHFGADPAAIANAMRDDPTGWLGSQADASRPGSPEMAIIVDQFEELYTDCASDAEREIFVRALRSLATAGPGPTIAIVIGLRIDFYADAARSDTLAEVLQHSQILVGPMSRAELTAAITEPATRAGTTVDDDLVDLLLRQFAPPGAGRATAGIGTLPLLSHALLETWKVSTRGGLSIADYVATGGIERAVEESAERAFAATPERDQDATRQVLQRLVRVGDDVVTRRAVTYSELAGLVEDDPAGARSDEAARRRVRELVAPFVETRLLTAREATVEMSHDALLGAWPRLGGWIDDDRDSLRARQRVADASRAWLEQDRDPAALARGSRLEEMKQLLDPDGPSSLIGRDERDFVTASVAAERAAATASRRRVRRLRLLVASATVFALVAASLAVVTARARRGAVTARDEALSRQLAVTAQQVAENDPAVGLQLSIAGYQIAPTTEARSTVLDLASTPSPTRYLGGAGSTAVAVSSSGSLMAVSDATTGTVQLFTAAPGGYRRAGVVDLGDPDVDVYALALTPDESVLAVGATSAAVTLWDVADPRRPASLGEPLHGPDGAVQRLAVSPDGDELAAVGAGDGVFRWDVSDPTDPSALPTIDAPGVTWTVTYHPDGRHLAFGDEIGDVAIWDISADPEHVATVSVAAGDAVTASFSPDGTTLATGSKAGELVVWDVSSLSRPAPLDVAEPQFDSWLNATAFSPDGTYIVAGSSDTSVRVWDTATWEPVQTLPHPASITQVAFAGDGALVTVAVDGAARLWDVAASVPHQMIGRVFSISASDDERLAVVSGEDVAIWDVGNVGRAVGLGEPIAELEGDELSAGMGAISPDGTMLARGTITVGELRLYDTSAPGPPQPIDVEQADNPTGVVHATGFSADGLVLAAGGDDSRVRLWDLSDRDEPRLAAVIEDPPGLVLGLAWHPDDRLLAVASAGAEVQLVDVSDVDEPRIIARMSEFDSEVYAVTFDPAGDTLAVGGTDTMVTLWDVGDPAAPERIGEPVGGPLSRIFSLAYNPGGDVLAAAVTDGTVWLWDVSEPDEPSEMAVLRPSDAPMYAVTFVAGGELLVGSGADRVVRVWDVDAESVVTEMCAAAGDPLTEAEWDVYVPSQPYRSPCAEP